MNTLLTFVICGLFSLGATAANDVPSERERHTAECVAALDVETDHLAAQVKAGRADLRSLLLDRLNAGAALIGAAYLNGARNEKRANRLLDAARDAQKSLPGTALAARQSACAQEGAQLLAKADGISRAVVSHFAQKRMHKMLAG